MAVKAVDILKRIAYDSALIPSEGSEVCCELAAPAKHSNKDPAGHAFHAFALRQAGHVGKTGSRNLLCAGNNLAQLAHIRPLVTLSFHFAE